MSDKEGSKMNSDDKPGCLAAILQALGLSTKAAEQETLLYCVRDDFLSPAERSFYHVLRTAVGDWAVICPKVSLNDLFFAKSGDHRANISLQNRIARKHVDFLLCDPRSTQPLLGIELDDSGHSRASRRERDRFVDQVFAAASLPLMRQPVQAAYDVRRLSSTLRSLAGRDQKAAAQACADPTAQEPPDVPPPPGAESSDRSAEAPSQVSLIAQGPPLCPKCGQPMVLRTVQKEGPRKGSRFWGCVNYPRCHGTREMATEDHR
jgi:hypothetical protein